MSEDRILGIMANQVVPTSSDADNLPGGFTLARCNDWRDGARRFHVGTGPSRAHLRCRVYDCRLTRGATR